MSTHRFYQSVIHATWINTKKKPFDDPRVRRAMHLVFDKQVLVEVVKDVAPMMVGGFIYPFSEFATPKEELVKRARLPGRIPPPRSRKRKALMAAAGHASGIKRAGLHGARCRHLQALGAGRSRRCCSRRWASSATCARWWNSVWFDDVTHRQFRPGDRRHGFDAARPVRLLQRLVPERRAAELLVLEQREVRGAAATDRPRGRQPRSGWR